MMLFEVGVRMERTLENGAQAKVLEQFVVDALSFTEAEATTTKEVSAYGTITDIVTIKRSRCAELISPLTRRQARRRKHQATFSSTQKLLMMQRKPLIFSSEQQ